MDTDGGQTNNRQVLLCKFLETLEVFDTKILMGGDAPSNLTIFLHFRHSSEYWRGIGFINKLPYCYKLEIEVVTIELIDAVNELTLRPQLPKSCREFATTSIPLHITVSISISSYSSVTVGRKKTSLP